MPDALLEKLCQSWPLGQWLDTTIVIAVSGGADSVALLRAIHFLKCEHRGAGRVVAAHFNHRLRGAESDDDEQFVEALCRSLGIPCEIGMAASPTAATASRPKCSEDEARQPRYEFLSRITAAAGARFLVTAHTADDQAETVLHRILRGTGIGGLAGISRTRELIPGVVLARPLLAVWRSEVLDFLDQHRQAYRSDSSNSSATYTRNRLRNELIPQLEREFNPRCREALWRLGELAREMLEVTEQQVDEVLRRCECISTAHGVVLKTANLGDASPYLVRAMFQQIWKQHGWPMREMSREKWNELQRLATSNGMPAKFTLPGNIQVARMGSEVRLQCQGDPETAENSSGSAGDLPT